MHNHSLFSSKVTKGVAKLIFCSELAIGAVSTSSKFVHDLYYALLYGVPRVHMDG